MSRPVPIALDGRFWRMLRVPYQTAPLSGEGARTWGGRWNAVGRAALYLSRDHATAIAEFHQGLPRPGTLVAYDVIAARIVDLTANPDATVIAAATGAWAIPNRDPACVPPGWAIAEALVTDGIDGALVLSSQQAGGVNLMLWRWHDAALPGGAGAAVRWFDPQGDLRA